MEERKIGSMQETKAQRWRALAILFDGGEALLYVGSSIVQIRENFIDSWKKYFTDETRKATRDIIIQKWNGAPDCGYWENQSKIQVPR